jgi:hypothetical protein
MDLTLELIGDLQVLRRQHEELLWNFNGLKHAQAANEIRFGMASIGPGTLAESGIAAVVAAIEEQTKTQRALKTMRVFHFQYMPTPKAERQDLPLGPIDPPTPVEDPAHRALLEAADLADAS